MRATLASVEGISGSGKTYLVQKLATLVRGSPVVFLSELSERHSGGLDHDIIQTLHRTGDPFFRSNTPAAVTLLLLALKVWDYEALIAPRLEHGHSVIEDRSVHTIAVYQAILLHPQEPARQFDSVRELLALAGQWRRIPDITFVIDDVFSESIARAERRNEAKYRAPDLELLSQAADLYRQLAEDDPSQFVLCDRRRQSDESILQIMKDSVLLR